MRRVALALTALTVTAACTATSTPAPPTPAPPTSVPVSASPPADPRPAGGGPCPYLDTTFVADTNGQRVSKVETSSDRPYPACFFYALTGKVQLTARIYV